MSTASSNLWPNFEKIDTLEPGNQEWAKRFVDGIPTESRALHQTGIDLIKNALLSPANPSNRSLSSQLEEKEINNADDLAFSHYLWSFLDAYFVDFIRAQHSYSWFENQMFNTFGTNLLTIQRKMALYKIKKAIETLESSEALRERIQATLEIKKNLLLVTQRWDTPALRERHQQLEAERSGEDVEVRERGILTAKQENLSLPGLQSLEAVVEANAEDKNAEQIFLQNLECLSNYFKDTLSSLELTKPISVAFVHAAKRHLKDSWSVHDYQTSEALILQRWALDSKVVDLKKRLASETKAANSSEGERAHEKDASSSALWDGATRLFHVCTLGFFVTGDAPAPRNDKEEAEPKETLESELSKVQEQLRQVQLMINFREQSRIFSDLDRYLQVREEVYKQKDIQSPADKNKREAYVSELKVAIGNYVINKGTHKAALQAKLAEGRAFQARAFWRKGESLSKVVKKIEQALLEPAPTSSHFCCRFFCSKKNKVGPVPQISSQPKLQTIRPDLT